MAKLSPHGGTILALEFAWLALLVDRPINLALLTGLATLFWLTAPKREGRLVIVMILALGTWSVVASQGLFYEGAPRTPLLRLLPPEIFPFGDPAGLHLYREGLWHGLVQSLRFDVLVLIGAGMVGRFGSDELAAGLRVLRLPPALCMLFTMSLRFLPLLAEELRTTWRAQRLRGFRPATAPPAMARTLLLPLVAAQLRKADEIAAALQARGFDPANPPGQRAGALAGKERAACLLGGALVTVLLTALLLRRLHESGMVFPGWIDWLVLFLERYV